MNIKRPQPEIGDRFGKLLVIAIATPRDTGAKRWMCRCDCGNEVPIWAHVLISGHTSSCGCYQRARASQANRIHGASRSRSRTYGIWKGIRQRCNNPNNQDYSYYGGRGIRVCERWDRFENFLADMGERPSSKHTIDRYPNPDGNYEPGNCRWATWHEQRTNRSKQRQAERAA